jgi:cell division control protein 6
LSSGPIFKDRNKLSPHYIPERLPHRDEQLRMLHSIYGDMIRNVENAYPRFTQIIGPTGTGKTCTAIRFGEQITEYARSEGVDLRYIYVNCKVDGATRYVLFRNLVRKLTPKISTRSLSPEEMIQQFVEYLQAENLYALITFDEIDYFVQTNPREHIIYDITRTTEMSPGESSSIIGGILIAKSLNWHERLDPGEKSTLGLGILEFPRYTAPQVKEILSDRVEEAFQPGAVSEEALDLICDITASPPVNGDIRVGLDLLYYSGNLADNQGFKRVLPDHVRKVYSEINPSITSEDVMSLDRNGKLILLALVRSLRSSGSAYIGLREIRRSYQVLCEEFDLKPTERFEEYVQDLIYRGIIDMKSLTELGISGASLVDLEQFLNSLAEKLRKEMK